MGIDEPIDQSKLLWHYTNWSALEGILQSRSIWASHVAFLNDEKEIKNAVGLAISEMDHGPGRNAPTDALEFAKQALVGSSEINICVASFSAAFDQLSQWRAYASSLPGVAIGFDRAAMGQLAERNAFRVQGCIYSPQEQLTHVKACIANWLERVERADKASNRENYMSNSGWLFAQDVVSVAPRLKHPKFSEEAEWRIVTDPIKSTDDWGFHRAGSMVVPHIAIKLDHPQVAFPIRSIAVGPNPHMSAVMTATTMLMQRYGVTPNVYASQIPYRNW